MTPDPPPLPNVPILGQPIRLISWFPTAVVVCTCRPGNDPLLVIGTSPSAPCPQCKKQYILDLLHHERPHPEHQQFGVGVILPPSGLST